MAYVSGKIRYAEDSMIPVLDNLAADSETSHQPIFVGSIQLANLKRQLEQQGINALLQEGVIYCQDHIQVYKVISPV